MGKAHTIRELVELRNKLADLSDEHAAGWPELERVLYLAELVVKQRIALPDVSDTAPKERRC